MAGQLKVNGVTLATESSGTLTVSNVDSATNRTNLGLGSIATQNANAVALTGGSLTGTEIDLKSSGTTIYKSDGTTALLSESTGVATLANTTLASTNTFPAGTIIAVGQPIKNGGNTSDQTSSGNVADTSFSITVNSGNYVLIQYNWTNVKNAGSGTTGHNYVNLYGGGLGVSPGITVVDAVGYQDVAETREQCAISYLDTNPGTNPTYGLYAIIYNTLNLRFFRIFATYYEIQV